MADISEDEFDDLKRKIDAIYAAVLGSVDGETRGIYRRLEIVEGWRKTIIRAVWGLYGAIVGLMVAFVGRKI